MDNEGFISKNRVVLKFLFLFLFFAVLSYLLFYKFIYNEDFSREFSAQIVAFLLNLLGVSASVDGYFITVPNFSLEVIYECIGIWAMVVYSSFVLAYPVSLKKKMIGITFGIPILLGVNTIRMVSLAIIGMSYPDIWEFAHVYFWQMCLIIFVIILILLWMEKVVKLQNE